MSNIDRKLERILKRVATELNCKDGLIREADKLHRFRKKRSIASSRKTRRKRGIVTVEMAVIMPVIVTIMAVGILIGIGFTHKIHLAAATGIYAVSVASGTDQTTALNRANDTAASFGGIVTVEGTTVTGKRDITVMGQTIHITDTITVTP